MRLSEVVKKWYQYKRFEGRTQELTKKLRICPICEEGNFTIIKNNRKYFVYCPNCGFQYEVPQLFEITEKVDIYHIIVDGLERGDIVYEY